MASKEKHMHQRCTFQGGGGGGEGGNGLEDMAPPSRGNLGAKFSKTSFPHFKTYFTRIDHCDL